jgi:uncharacterized protein
MRSTPHYLAAFVLLAGCAAHQPDHFYALAAEPAQPAAARGGFTRQISLHVSLPSLVDRGELVLSSRGNVSILEHERWASPLLDQFSSTLGLDLEARRPDLLITDRSLEQNSLPLSKVVIEVVKITAERGSQVSVETRWRVTDSASGQGHVGRNVFAAPMASADYDQIAAALSKCIAQLADRLMETFPVP